MIRSLAYVGFSTPAVDEWATFGPDILGAQIAHQTDDVLRLRVDDADWRLALHRAEENDVAYFGWDVGESAEDLATACEKLAAAGYAVDVDADLAAQRGVAEAGFFVGPFGFRHELICGQHAGAEPFVAGRAMNSGFVTGSGGLGHVVLVLPDMEIADAFFTGTLGFKHSDDVEVGRTIRFLHCNPRHHTVAFSVVPGLIGLHHLMLEVEDPDDVGRAYDLAVGQDLPMAMTLGRHPNDEMFSFYVRSPSGFEVEYGSGGKLIDPDEPWMTTTYDATSIWGHAPPETPLRPGILRPVPSS